MFKKIPAKLIVGGFFAAVFVILVAFNAPHASSSTGGALSGWAWSDNVGWVSLSGSGYGLTTDGSGNVGGYAWSDNIGWIRPAQSGDGCPGTGAVFSGGSLTGWLYVLSAATSQGSWDGCISLSGSGYGVTNASNPSYNANYAWGSTVVGWLSFNMSSSCSLSYVCTDSTHSQYTDSQCNVQNLVCQYGCNSGSGQCNNPNPPAGCISINSYPASCSNAVTTVQVKSGSTATLYWNVTNAAGNCALAGTNGQTLTGQPGVQSTGVVTLPITQKTQYTLTCTAADTSTATYTGTVKIIPVYKEL